MINNHPWNNLKGGICHLVMERILAKMKEHFSKRHLIDIILILNNCCQISIRQRADVRSSVGL